MLDEYHQCIARRRQAGRALGEEQVAPDEADTRGHKRRPDQAHHRHGLHHLCHDSLDYTASIPHRRPGAKTMVAVAHPSVRIVAQVFQPAISSAFQPAGCVRETIRVFCSAVLCAHVSQVGKSAPRQARTPALRCVCQVRLPPPVCRLLRLPHGAAHFCLAFDDVRGRFANRAEPAGLKEIETTLRCAHSAPEQMRRVIGHSESQAPRDNPHSVLCSVVSPCAPVAQLDRAGVF